MRYKTFFKDPFAAVVIAFAIMLSATTALAQTITDQRRLSGGGMPSASQAGGVTVTASAVSERLRITAPSSILQMRVEIYSPMGQKVWDSEIRGNVFDWHVQDGQAQRPSAGDYACVVTVKNVAGRVTQKLGTISVGDKDVRVGMVETAPLSAPQSQAIGPVEEDSGWTILTEDQNQTTTVIANDGTDGQIVRGRGAISFRLGDFFAGKDKEQMRLTEAGNLGIGTSLPEFKLDVAGAIRAREGFVFNDGSTLNVNDEGVLTRTSADGSVTPNIAGTGTQNKLAKWTDNSGTLGDSALVEVGGKLGLGTSTPNYEFTLMGNDVGLQILTPGTGGTAADGFRFGIDSTNKPFLWNQEATDLFFGTSAVERMRITAGGNVGIGTTNPDAKLSITATGNGARVLHLGTERPWVFKQLGTGAGTALELTGADPNNNNKHFVINTDGNVGIGTGTGLPLAKLDVRGNVKLGSNGQLFAPGGEENLRIIRGLVYCQSTPSIIAGAGFSVSRRSEGDCDIDFGTPFGSAPSITATAYSGTFGDPETFALIGGVSTRSAEIIVAKRSDGSFTDWIFYFIAIGPR